MQIAADSDVMLLISIVSRAGSSAESILFTDSVSSGSSSYKLNLPKT